MSLGYTPAVVHLDPEGGDAAGLWDRLLASEPRPRPILITADAQARRSGWAPRAAVALADALAARLPAVTLVDLEFDDPQLHHAAGIANDEGIADALLFGASVEHLALTGPGHRARVVPGGAFIPSPDDLLTSPGWTRVIEEATAGGGGLLLYVPQESSIGKLGNHVDRSIALRADPAAPGTSPAAAGRLIAVVSPPAIAASPPPEAAPVSHGEAGDAAAAIGDLRARQGAGLAAAGAAGAVAAAETAAAEARVAAPSPASRRRMIAWAAFVVLAVAILAGVWHYVGRDYLERRRAAASQAEALAPAAQQPAVPAGEPLPYSVAIEAHPDLPTASERVDALTAAQAGVGFYVAPILIESDLYYRVLAGPMRDSATAAAVMDTLIARGHKTGGSDYDIKPTPYTFLLGEFATRAEADGRMEELRPLGIPSYVIELPYTSGPPRYRLYSGAYSGPAEADVMRQLLQRTGLADSLVYRTGRISQ